MRIAILSSGTRGDLQPMLVVGDALQAAGHSVSLTANPTLAPWARRSGLEVVEAPLDLEAWFGSPGGKALLASGNTLAIAAGLRARMAECADGTLRACTEACRGADLVVSTALTLYRGNLHAKALAVPHAAMLTFPVHPTREFASVLLPVRTLGLAFLNRAFYELLYRRQYADQRAALAATEEALGLPPGGPERPRVDQAPAAVLCSPTLVSRPADWGRHVVMTGTVHLPAELRARLGEAEPPAGLEAWLTAGPPPIYFGFGSMPVLDPPAALKRIADVTARLGQRGLICAGWTDFGDAPLPHHLFLAATLDHDAVLPFCRAAVHHGGAGTTSAAIRAGLPSVVASVFIDQAFWGWRLESLGAGVHRPFRKLTERTLEADLRAVLEPAVVARARYLGVRLREEDGLARAVAEVERWGGGRPA